MEELLRQPPVIDPPVMNAAGSLGFAPNLRLPLEWGKFGAFITNPISLKPRKPASSPRWRTFSGGGVLHSGHPNPGFRSVIRQYAPQWAASPLPVIVHLLADYPDEISRRIEQLETLENIQAVELGFPDGITETEVKEMISAAVGEKPVIARLPFFTQIRTMETVSPSILTMLASFSTWAMSFFPNSRYGLLSLYGSGIRMI
jgi:hypothetical protein